MQAFFEHFSQFEQDVQERLEQVYTIIKSVLPQSDEVIAYGIPTFKIKGKNVIHFAGYQNHIGIYPGAEAIEVFKDKLKKYKTSKGTIQIPHTEVLPTDLIKELAKFRLSKVTSST